MAARLGVLALPRVRREVGSSGATIAKLSPGGISVRKKLFGFVLVLAAVVGTSAFVTATPAAAGSCPKNSHLIVCPTYSFCCPNNAFCVCLS
jgi:hypothetical protein